jgi:hypothetical protein
LLVLAVAVLLAACGESSSDSNEPSGTFRVAVSEASFPTSQRLGQTSLLRLGIRNTGDKTVPGLAVSFTIAGKEGVESSLPFAIHDPGADLAQAERPVWVLAERYPRLVGSSESAGATSSSHKTFDFGALKPGETTTGVWKLSAVRAGRYTLLYSVDAGLGGTARAKTKNGVAPGGSFKTEIASALPETEVTESGEVVEIGKRQQGE